MSHEKLSHGHEGKVESLDLDSHIEKNLKRIEKEAATVELGSDHKIEELSHKAAEQAVSGHETTVGEHEQPKNDSPVGMQRELKADAYKRTLQRVQKDLSAPERTLSRIVHQPVIESLSEVGSKTIARPSGIVGGGIVSLVGSIILLYMAKHYGFRYNFFIFFVLFVGGFVLGSLLELIVRLILPKRHNV